MSQFQYKHRPTFRIMSRDDMLIEEYGSLDNLPAWRRELRAAASDNDKAEPAKQARCD